ncbi:hypothetical protein [Acinetobacter oleivorans]|uniref:hypothetical protein n=1 Tax=Acinetobacter oleivorans TaxID=1148157 RepID=UPI00148F253D|nr:hypothetical protein [Acinetobacter oleivorans]
MNKTSLVILNTHWITQNGTSLVIKIFYQVMSYQLRLQVIGQYHVGKPLMS